MPNAEDLFLPSLRKALQFATESLSAERAMVVYQGCGSLQGLDAPTLWLSGEISTGLFQMLLEEGEPMVMVDAAEDERTRDQTSAILSALRSVLFVPLRNAGGTLVGLFYCDHRRRAGAFDNQQLGVAKQFVDETLLPELHEACRGLEGEEGTLDWEALTETAWL